MNTNDINNFRGPHVKCYVKVGRHDHATISTTDFYAPLGMPQEDADQLRCVHIFYISFII